MDKTKVRLGQQLAKIVKLDFGFEQIRKEIDIDFIEIS